MIENIRRRPAAPPNKKTPDQFTQHWVLVVEISIGSFVIN
jgi:hypothetical protein